MCAAASQACPYLGRCEDPENYYFFPTVGNCCHTEKRPFAVEPAHQAKICLGGDWAQCPRYKAPTGVPIAERQVVASPPAAALKRGLSAKIIAALFAGGVTLLLALFLLFRLLTDSSQPPPVTSSPTPTREAMTFTVEPTPVPDNPTQVVVVTDEPTSTPSRPSASPTLEPSSTWTPTSTPSATSTRTPTATATRTPTRTPIPSSTATPSPSMTPTRTPSPSPRPTRKPTATSTRLPAPVLLAPPDGQLFSENEEIVLVWQPLAGLPPGAYYAITVAYSHLGATWHDQVPWTRDTSWTLSEHDYLLELCDDGWFRWSVQAVRQTGVDADGKPVGSALSAPSEVRTLGWMKGGGGPMTPTPSVWPTPTVPPP